MELIDTHAHLDYDYENKTVKELIDSAKSVGVGKIISVTSEPKSLKKAYDIAHEFENIYHSLGIHPHEAKDYSATVEAEIKDLNSKKCVAIGEIGLDFFYNHSDQEIQKKVFIRQTELARELNKPIIVHIRDADAQSYDILKTEYKDHCNGVIHCYTGTRDQLKKYLDLGMYVSFTGIITFKKSTDVQESAKYAPDDRIMVETDCPFLAPMPYRGQKNYPEYVLHVAKKLADLRATSLENIADITTANALRFFGI
jgi:TatD DNase family protein